MRYVLIIAFIGLSFRLSAKELIFRFYSDEIRVEYDESLCVNRSVKPKDKSIKAFYEKLDKAPYQGLLAQLRKYRERYGLSDWFYYRLLCSATEELFKNKSENYKTAFCWFMLNKSGYDATIRYFEGKRFLLYVHSKESPVNAYFHTNRKKYILLNDSRKFSDKELRVKHLKFFPNASGRPFALILDSLPRFSNPEIIKKEIIFKANGRFDTLNVVINKTNIDALADMPQFWTQEYFKLAPSKDCSASLLSFFRDRTRGMSDSAVVRYLLSFVRMGFKFEDDAVSFGYQKPMVTEEVLYYPTADCEDKSALFFYLVKELLNIDVLVLVYPKHANIAVLLDKPYGKPFVYKGKQYSVCETNVLGDSERAGIGYNTETSPPKVVYEYHPSER